MWIIFALSASVLWGLTYIIDEQIFKHISVVTSIAVATFCASIVMFLFAYFSGTLAEDLKAISSSKQLLWFVIMGTITFILAELFIGLSISNKNATIAGLIEISYPIFIAIFAYVLFGENQISFGTMVGGTIVFIGIGIIYFFNR